MSIINNRIKEIRKAEGLTQERFAERLGISLSNLKEIELGRNTTFSIKIIEKLHEEFSVSPDYVFGISDNNTNQHLREELEDLMETARKTYEKAKEIKAKKDN